MPGVNKVIIMGNLGQDPETRYLPSGEAVCNISVATSEKWKDKQTGQPQERTEWHKIVFFGKKAEVIAQYFHKGSKIYVEGSLQTRKWQDQAGNDRYSTDIKASTFEFVDSNPQQGGQQGGYNQAPQPQQQGYAPASQPVGNVQQPHRQAPGAHAPPQQPPQNQQPPQQQYPPQHQQGVQAGPFADDIPF